MVGSRSSCSGFLLGLGVIILLLVKDSNAFTKIQGMKKLEPVKDEDANLVAPTRKDFDAKKEIMSDVIRASEVALQHERSKVGGRKIMMDNKNQHIKAVKNRMMTNLQESSKMTGANFVENAISERKLKMQHKLSTTNTTTTLHHDQKLKAGVFMTLNADYGRMARTHPPRNN